jgi:ribosome-binding factor A
MSQRIQRVNQLLKQEISQLLLREIDFSDALVTVTQVDCSPDLRQAKIKISILPDEKAEQVLRIIEKNIYHLQQILNKKLNMKIVPKIIFEIDKTEADAQRIEEILDKISKG